MTIRNATLADAPTIVAFNKAMARETEGKVLDQEILRAGVEAVLRDSEKGFYLLAERDDNILGALMITTEWSDWRNGIFWWIQSVYVQSEARRQGVYSALHDHVRRLAQKSEDICGLRLYVEKDNTIAQKTYRTLGMQPRSYQFYEEVF